LRFATAQDAMQNSRNTSQTNYKLKAMQKIPKTKAEFKLVSTG